MFLAEQRHNVFAERAGFGFSNLNGGSVQNGDAVFFQEAKVSSTRKSEKVRFKGHGFGVLLGHVPPFQKDPPPDHLIRLMGTIGMVKFDDVAEFLGDEKAAECVKKFEDKYYGKPVHEPAKDATPADTSAHELANAEAPAPSGLLNTLGQPIETNESLEVVKGFEP